MVIVGKFEIWNCFVYQQMWKVVFIEDGVSFKEKKKKKKILFDLLFQVYS